MRLPNWLRNNESTTRNRRRAKAARARLHRLRIESLEDRVVPSADTLVPNITATIVNNLKSASDDILGSINSAGSGNAFDTPIPGVLQANHDINGFPGSDKKIDDKDTHVPAVRDALSQTVDLNLDGTLPTVGPFFSLAGRYNFVQGLGIGGAEQALAAMDLDGNRRVDVTEMVNVLVMGAMQSRLQAFDATGMTVADLEANFFSFLNTLAEPTALNNNFPAFGNPLVLPLDLIDFDLTGVVNNSGADVFSYDFTVSLNVRNQYLLDLGQMADQNEIVLPEKLYLPGIADGTGTGLTNAPNQRFIVLTASVAMPVRFSVALPPVTDPPTGVSDSNFAFAIPGDVIVAVDDQVAGPGDGGPSLQGLVANVGFLGTVVTDAGTTSKFNLHMDWKVTVSDPSSPAHIGFTQSLPATSSSGSLTAATALGNDPPPPLTYPLPIKFDLTVGTNALGSSKTAIEVPAGTYTTTGLRDYLDGTALGSALTAIVTVGLTGDNRLTLTLPATNVTPLGFSNEQFNIGSLNAGAAPSGGAALGSTSSTVITFLLNRGGVGSVPRLVTVTTTPANDDSDGDPTNGIDGMLTLAGLVADVQAGLNAAGFTGGNAVTAGSSAGHLTLSAGALLEITRTLTLDAKNEITTTELNDPSFGQFIKGTADTSDDKFQIVMPLNVRDGVDFGEQNNPGISFAQDPFTFTNASLTFDSANVKRLTLPLKNLDGILALDDPTGAFQQYLDFNVVGPGEALGMIDQLENWLKQLRNTDMLGGFVTPFAQTVLGDLLAFDDLLHDTLITDDVDTDDAADNVGKLLAKGLDPDQKDAFLATFGTAQELGARLNTLKVLTRTDPNDDGEGESGDNRDFAAYNRTAKHLTYQVGLSHLFASANVGSDFNEDVLGSLDPIAQISTQSKIHLQATGRFDAILGIEMGPGTIRDTTPLNTLNGGIGAGIEPGIAFTGAADVIKVFGRLSANATFDVSVTTASGTVVARVTVLKSDTDENTTLDRLRLDIDAALAAAKRLSPLPDPAPDPLPTENLSDRLEAKIELGRVVIRAKAPVQHFEMTTSTGNTAYTELGLPTTNAASVFLGVQPATVNLSQNATFNIEATVNNVFSSTPVSVTKAMTDGNNTLTDLVNDINTALAGTALVGKIAAGRSGDTLFLTGIDSTVQSFRVVGTSTRIGELGFGRERKTFDGSAAATVEVGPDQIKITSHGYQTGDALIYANGGGRSIGGLNNGQTYFVVRIDADTIKLATTHANASSNPAVFIDLTDVGTGTAHRLQTAVAGPSLIAPRDVNDPTKTNVFGQLTANALFSIQRNADVAVPIPVTKLATIDPTDLSNRNRSVADLVQDINAVIAGTALAGQIEAVQVADMRIGFRAIDVSVRSFEVTTAVADTAATQMGLFVGTQSTKATLQVGAIKLAPFFYGPKTDAHFQVVVTGGSSADTKNVTVKTSETLTNATIQDLVGDVRRALDTAFGSVANNPLLVGNDGDRILFKPKATGAGVGVTAFTVSATNTDPAITDLFLFQAGGESTVASTVSSTSDRADLLIYANSGQIYRVTLDNYSTPPPPEAIDDATTIEHVRDSINNHTPGKGTDPAVPFSAFINSINAGINVHDNSGVGGNLRIDSVNGSHAAQALGIFGTDAGLYDASVPAVLNQTVEGTRIATKQLADRFFLRQVAPGTPILAADVTIGAAVFDGSGGPNSAVIGLDKLRIPQHGFLNGDPVVYDHGPGGTDLGSILGIGGLDTGTTYYVIVADENSVQLAATPEDAAEKISIPFIPGAGTAHQLRSELALDANFGFVGVELTGSGALRGTVGIGLQDTSATAVVPVANLLKSLSKDQNADSYVDVFDLATLVSYPTVNPTTGTDFGAFTFDVALPAPLPGNPVQLTSGAEVTFTLDGFGNPFAGPRRVEFAAPAAVNVGNDTITAVAHGLTNGMEIVYRHGIGGTDIGGLLEGKSYFVIVEDINTIKLATSRENALAETAINLTTAGAGAHQQLAGFASVLPDLDVDADDPALGDLLNLEDVKFDNVINALQGLSDFLGQFSQFSFLNDEIPLLGVSFSDLVDIAERFQTAVTEIVKNPAGSIQLIEQKIRETFGLPPNSDPMNPIFKFELVDDGDGDTNLRDMLKVKLNVEKAFSKPLSVDLDLSDQLPGISIKGSAGLNAAGFLKAALAFGVDLDTPTDLYLFTGSTESFIAAGLSASANNLSFNAALGPAGIFITGGDVQLTLGGGLLKPGGSATDKALISDILTNLTGSGFTPSFNGTLEATLPVFFPTQSNFKGDIEFGAALTLTPDFSLDFDTTLEVPPDILNFDFSELSLFDSLGLAVDTFDAFLAGVQDLLDGEIFGLKLPLIGDKLSAGAEFINDLRRGVVQPFRELVETAATQGTSIVQTFLFDLLGPGSEDGDIKGLGLLLDPLDIDDDHPDGTPATQADRDHITQIVKITENLTGPIKSNFAQWDFTLGQVYAPPLDFDFDLGFPGLSLDLEGGLDFELGWTLRLGFGISIADGPYIVVTRTNSDDPLSHDFPNTPDSGFHDSFEDISPNAPDPNGDPRLSASAGRVNGLASLPDSATTVFAATEYGGIYKSIDGGDKWTYLDGHLPQVAWDVEASSVNQVYATSFFDGRVDSIAGINVSADGGTTWTHPATAHVVNDGSADDNTPQTGYREVADQVAEPSAFGISIARDDPAKVAIGTNTGLALSSDSGATWRYVDPTQSAVFFGTDDDDLGADDTAILDRYITFLQRDGALNVVVSGHTDTVGDDGYNQDLSDRRAQAVVDYLTSHGVNPIRITKMAFGETRLAVPTGNGVDEPANRRTELNVLAGNVFDVVYQAGGLIDVVGTFGHARSTDDGVTWELHPMPTLFGAASLAASPDESYVLFAVGTDDALYESDDGGVIWTALGQDITPQGRQPFVTVNDRAMGTGAYDVWFGDVQLWRFSATTPGVPAPGGATRVPLMAFSSDGIDNDGNDQDNFGNPTVLIDGADFNEWWLPNPGNTNVPERSDAGAHDDVGDVVFDATVAFNGRPLLHSNDGGVYRNNLANGVAVAPAWLQPTASPHAWFVMGFAGVDQAGGDNEDIYVALQDDGIWALTTSGSAAAATQWHTRFGADAFDVAADNDMVMWNMGALGGTPVHRFPWNVATQGMSGYNTGPELNNYPGVFNPTPPPISIGGDVVIFNTGESVETWGDDKFAILMRDTARHGDGGLFITSNIKAGTVAWTPLGDATEPNSASFGDLQIGLQDPLHPGVPTFYVTAGPDAGNGFTADQLWKFVGTTPTDSWIQIDNNIDLLIPGTSGVRMFAVDHSNSNRLYAVADTPLGPQMVRSNDGGTTWERDLDLDSMMDGGGAFLAQNQHGPQHFPFEPIPGFGSVNRGLGGYGQTTMLAFDPENPSIIVAGAADAGLFLSTDDGANWRLLTDPLGTDPAIPHLPRPRFVHFDHEGGITTLYVASQGRGVWRIRVDAPVSGPIAPDAGEAGGANNTEGTAEVFNLSEDADADHAPELNDRTIHNADDVDFYKFTAEHTGNAIVSFYFDKLFGELDSKVKLPNGTILTSEQFNLKDHLDLERLIFPVVQGEVYIVEVSGAGDNTGYYDLVIERSVPELDLFVVAGIETGSVLSGKLAFLQLDATAIDDNFDGITTDGPLNNGKDPTQIRVDFTVDIYNGDRPGDERLSLFELGSVDAAIGVTADAEVNLALELGLNKDLLPDTISAALPTLQANFLLDWSVGGPISDLSLDGGLKLIEFRDIGVDLGSFLSETIGPVVAKIQEITGPLQPIIDIVTARIPVLSDLAGRTVTLADIAAAFGEFDPAMIYAVADIISLVNSFNFSPDTNLFLKFGDFKIFDKEHPEQSLLGREDDPTTPDVDESKESAGLLLNPNLDFGNDTLAGLGIPDFGEKLGGLDGLENLSDLTADGALSSALGSLSGEQADVAATTSSMFSGGFSSTPDDSGFDFPIFKDPSQFIGLLLGRDATLITYDLPQFLMDFKWEVSFPIYGPLWGVVSAGVGMKIDVAFGYDTAGVRKFAEGGFQNPLDLIGGFFISDTNKPDGSFGVDVPELVFSGSIGVGAELNAGIASAGVTANIILTVNFDLYDPNHDGKVRIDELVSTFLFEARNGNPLLAPIAIFDVNGNIAFQLSAFIKILFARFDFNITPPIVLFEFSIPFDREPILATERGDGSLLLNIGPNATARQNGDVRDISETIRVKEAGSGQVAVWSETFGVPESAAQLYSIGGENPVVVGFGGEGNDVIDVSGLTTHAALLEGGSGNDTVTGGGAADSIKGDVGDDSLVAGGGNDIVYGGDGNDYIDGAAGLDILFGDAGRVTTDAVSGAIRSSLGTKDGNDTIRGGAGNDIAMGGGGSDFIGGDVDPASLDGAGDDDFLFGDGASISAPGGVATFVRVTNSGGTIMFGTMVPNSGGTPDPKFVPISLTERAGGGPDTVHGHGGADVVYGGAGDDNLDGGDQDDVLFGEAGLDTVSGGGHADFIMGGTEDDRIFGRREENYAAVLPDGNDTIFGQSGNDFIRGNSGDDRIQGNAGADIIFGDQDQDFILGQTEPDLIFGGPGRDFIDGGTANDIIFGDDGFVAWVEFGGLNSHKIIGLVAGNPDVYEGATDLTLGGLDNTILTTDDEKEKTQDLIKTLVNAAGDGNDTAVGGEADDIILGGADALFDGAKGDTLFGDFNPAAAPGTPGAPVGAIPAGDDIAIGDGGRLQFAERRRANVRTLPGALPADVGNDTVAGNGGSDLVFGGGASDTLFGRMAATFTNPALAEDPAVRDDDVIIGDDGEIQYHVIGIPDGVNGGYAPLDPNKPGESKEPPSQYISGIRAVFHHIFTNRTDAGAVATGGSDTAFGNKHDDIVFGGIAGDVLKGDDGVDGSDVMLGDNGQIDFALDDDGLNNKIAKIFTTDIIETTGGADTVEGQDDRDVILGGVNNGGTDLLYGDRATPTAASIAADSDDVLLGDNGELVFNLDTDLDTLDRITSYLDGDGGADVISGNKGADALMGGTAGDTMYGDDANFTAGSTDGEDIMLGDNGEVQLIGTTGRLLIQVVGMPVASAVDVITTTDTVEGTGGADTMSGNAKADIVLGGVNNGGIDTLYGDRAAPTDATILNDGDDILLGDNGLLDFTLGADTDRGTLDLIQSFEDGDGGADVISGNKGADVAIGGTAGDTIYGDDAGATAAANDGADMLLGDNADIFLVAAGGASGGDLKLVLDAAVMKIKTTDEEHPEYGGSDTVSGNAKGDIIAGGVQGDYLYGDRETPNVTTTANDGNDTILGDNGAFEWLSTGRLGEIVGIDIGLNNPALFAKYGGNVADTFLTTLDLITTEQPTSGGRDFIFGDEGQDFVAGGTDLDTIYGDDGNEIGSLTNRDVLFGDHGRIYPQFSTLASFQSRNFFAIDIGNTAGGEGDKMWGEEGDDVMLGQQGDDRMFGGSQDDDMIGGHNVKGGYDELTAPAIVATLNPPVNDLMDGGAGDDAMTGDNTILWRRGDDLSPRFRLLTDTKFYTTTNSTITTNVDSASQSDPDDAVGRDIELVDHSDAVEADPQGRFGNDVMAGGSESDVMYGQLGHDLMQGDGFIGTNDGAPLTITRTLDIADSGSNPDTDDTLYFNIPEATGDADDYMEGNGGNDLMYGNLGQDDMIGGSSALFGLTSEVMRPDGADIIFGGAGIDILRNDIGDATEDGTTHVITTTATGHARDADFIMGDNANVFRPVKPVDLFHTFNYDNYTNGLPVAQQLKIIPRAMQLLDYTLGGGDFAGGGYNASGQATPTGGVADNGLFDLIHGESGDDFIFGMTGSDVIFGEGQDDDIVGGYGHDWISGGTGQDGMIGDDGIISTSRNSIVGEPLHNVAGLLANDPSTKYNNGNVLDELISTPGNIQIATINVSGQLKKTMDVTPFSYDNAWNALDDEFPDNADQSPFADDIQFGGLGSDWQHGGSGDDAMSGAEALSHAYVPVYNASGDPIGILDLGYAAFDLPNPVNPGDLLSLTLNPGDVLAFNPEDTDGQHLNNRFRPGEFALYDEYDPLRKIEISATGELWKPGDPGTGNQFVLNFNQLEGIVRPGGVTPSPQSFAYPAVRDDGADAIFGDLGNDWIVGGSGRDNAYGGWGNDLMNADDDQTTIGDAPKHGDPLVPGANDRPDTHPTYEDRNYGGAGRDVLIGNTGGDRLIDWVGEYNSFLVPYAPYGEASVSRTLMPFLPEYLYALSRGDGADPTRATDTGSDPVRNGEPAGETGLVLQKDFAWPDQTGAPADPQAGNIPGGPRDVLRSADFNNTQGNPQEAGFFTDSGKWEISAGAMQVSADAPKADAVSVYHVNAYLPNYFEILATIKTIKPTAGWKANAYVVFDYFSPTDFKFAGIDISTNKVVVGHRASSGWAVDAFTNKQLKPDIFYNMLVAINGTTVTVQLDGASSFTHTFAPRVIDGLEYGLNQGMVGVGSDSARGSFDNIAVRVLPPQLTFEHTETFDDGVANLFTGESMGTWTIPVNGGNGRFVGTPATGSDRAFRLVDLGIGRGLLTDSYLELSAKLSTQAAGGFVFDDYGAEQFKYVTLDVQTGKVIIGHHTNNGWTVDASVTRTLVAGTDYTLSVMIKGSTVSVALNGAFVVSHGFNAVAVDGGFGVLSKAGTSSFDEVTIKTDDPAFDDALPMFADMPSTESAPAIDEEQLAPVLDEAIRRWQLANGNTSLQAEVRVAIANLPGQYLGQTHGTTIYLDVNAAGHGWFIDSTPWEDSEFAATGDQGEQGRMDLLTVVMHELGHAIGHENGGSGVMSEMLSAGTRLVPNLPIVATGTLIPADDLSIDATTANPRTPTGSQPAGAIDGSRHSVPFVAPEFNRPPEVLWNMGRLSRGESTMVVDPSAELQRSLNAELATLLAAGSLALYAERAGDLTGGLAKLDGLAEPLQIGSEIGLK